MESSQNVITPKAFRAVLLWAAVLALLYALVGYFAVRKLSDYKTQSALTRGYWRQNADIKIKGVPAVPADHAEDSAAQPARVEVGIFVNRVSEIALRDSSWTADFDLWFRWKDARINPGETFQIANGEIEAREKQENIVEGGSRYERYRVKARLAKQFDPTRFPFVDEPLIIELEDSVHDGDVLQFVPDQKDSGVSPTALIHGVVEVEQTATGVRSREFGSVRGRLSDGSERSVTRSQFALAMILSRPGLRFHFKLFNVFFFSVAIALLVFFIKPTMVDPRFGLGCSAVFAVIGNSIAIATQLPYSREITMADMVNAVALGTIVLTLVQSVISLYLYDSLGLEKLSVFFDKVSFVVFAAGYVAVNIALPMAAR